MSLNLGRSGQVRSGSWLRSWLDVVGSWHGQDPAKSFHDHAGFMPRSWQDLTVLGYGQDCQPGETPSRKAVSSTYNITWFKNQTNDKHAHPNNALLKSLFSMSCVIIILVPENN